jgi:peptidoglycan/LPS O-acetylase OafA/YrhL
VGGRFYDAMSTAPDISTRSRIGLLIYGMTNAVLFGIGIVLVLSIEVLSQHAWLLIPLVVIASLVLAWPISWLIAPRLRKPLWRRRQLAAEGAPVGTPEERRELASKEAVAGRPLARR